MATMKCPKCGRWMAKNYEAEHLISGAYFYECCHCGHTSELLKEADVPFGDNYPAFLTHQKKVNEKKLLAEQKKIIEEMQKKFGHLTDNDKIDLRIDLELFGKEKGQKDE